MRKENSPCGFRNGAVECHLWWHHKVSFMKGRSEKLRESLSRHYIKTNTEIFKHEHVEWTQLDFLTG